MIRGIRISDYRSIGKDQRIGPLGVINLFVGPNNSGKSNVLRFVNENIAAITTAVRNGDRQLKLKSDPHVRRNQATHGGVCVAASLEEITSTLRPTGNRAQRAVEEIHKRLAPNDEFWIDDQWPNQDLINEVVTWADRDGWYSIWSAQGRSGGDIREHWIPDTLARLRQLVPAPPKVFAIPIDRQAGTEAEAAGRPDAVKMLGGRGVIRALAAMQSPQHTTYDEDRKRFATIEEFVRTVTDDPTAKISVPHTQTEILVRMKGQPFLPLASLGSGIEQVVLHAVAATSTQNAVVTFEEPELHLHPVLQRQLITFLAKTSNQYFISTHSAHLIDALHADTFHVRLIDGETVIEKAITDAQRHQVCSDLGYRPSDIVQANCVIWVEGPSDRIYVRHWLKQYDEHLREYVHYSIMFYGGKLLSHLSVGETDTVEDGLQDLIQLRLLNREVAVIIDSDRQSESDVIRETKKRVAEEISKHGGLAWISAGREIENYVPSDVLRAAVDAVAPGRGGAVKSGQYEKALPSQKPNSKVTVDKVATAKKVDEVGCILDMLDLRDRIRELSTFIRKANGLAVLG